jgi:hypothetical protein
MDPSPLSCLTLLTSLHVRSSNLTVVDTSWLPPDLVHLKLRKTYDTNTAPAGPSAGEGLARLTRLVELDMHCDVPLPGTSAAIRALTALTRLILCPCDGTVDEVAALLPDIPNLHTAAVHLPGIHLFMVRRTREVYDITGFQGGLLCVPTSTQQLRASNCAPFRLHTVPPNLRAVHLMDNSLSRVTALAEALSEQGLRIEYSSEGASFWRVVTLRRRQVDPGQGPI